MPMTDNYTYFYILNSTSAEKTEEILIDFKALDEFDRLLQELPEFSPEDSVLEKIYKFI
jgi:hypothetical protein